MEADEPILPRIVQSLKGGDDERWPEFHQAIRDLVRRSVFAAGGASRDEVDFLGWFPGWLYGKRMQAVFAALETKLSRGECSDEHSQNAFLGNYLASTVKSAVADFYKRDRRARSLGESEDLPSRVCLSSTTSNFATSFDDCRRRWRICPTTFECRSDWRFTPLLARSPTKTLNMSL